MVNHQRRRVLGAAGMLLLPALGLAESWPNKSRPIRVFAPFGAGTSTDVLARAVARGVSERYGVDVVIDNRPGGEGVIGVNALLGAAPDGYNILFTSLSTQVLNPHLFKALPYDPLKDMIPLAGLASTPLMVNFGKSTTFKTVGEFIAAAKSQPGKYSIGSSSATTRVAGVMLSTAAGIETLSVPYSNFTNAMTDLAAGEIDVVIVDAATAGSFYKHGVRPLATTSARRSELLPDVPTLQEAGVKGFDLTGWFAAYAHVNTPPAIVAALREMIRDGVNSQYVSDVYRTTGMQLLDIAGEPLASFQERELDKWGEAIRAAGLENTL